MTRLYVPRSPKGDSPIHCEDRPRASFGWQLVNANASHSAASVRAITHINRDGAARHTEHAGNETAAICTPFSRYNVPDSIHTETLSLG